MSDVNCSKCRDKIVVPNVCQGCLLTPYCSQNCLHEHESSHKNTCNAGRSKLIDAYCRAASIMASQFPRSRLEMIQGLPWEGYHHYEESCLVARIMWNITYLRICMFIVDPMGSALFVAFYIDEDTNTGYYNVQDLKPGNIIIINRAELHRFMDGQVGLRLEDPSKIRVVRV